MRRWRWRRRGGSRGRVVHAHRRAVVGAVVGSARVAARVGHARPSAAAGGRRARLLVPRLRPRLQAQVLAQEPPEVGVRQGAPVPVPLLRVPRQAKDAHRAPHGAHAPRAAPQAGTLHQARQRRRVHAVTSHRTILRYMLAADTRILHIIY